MSAGFELSPDYYDIGWDRQPEPRNRDGLQLSQVQGRSDWIVKLQFTQGSWSPYLLTQFQSSHIYTLLTMLTLICVKQKIPAMELGFTSTSPTPKRTLSLRLVITSSMRRENCRET